MTNSVSNNYYYSMQNISNGQAAVPYAVQNNELANSNPAVNISRNMFGADIKNILLLSIPSFFGILGLTHLINKGMDSADYSKTFAGKLTAFGDTIAENKVYKSVADWTSKNFKASTHWCDENIVKKVPFLEALKNPVSPVWEMAVSNLQGYTGSVVGHYLGLIDSYERSGGNLANLGLTKDALKELKENKYNPETRKKLLEIFETARKKGVTHIKESGMMGRNLSINQEIAKLKASIGTEAKSGLGKALAKVHLYGPQGLMFTVFGGLTGGLMSAFFLGSMFNSANKQEKGKKITSFLREAIDLMLFFPFAALAGLGIYSLGGLKYTGLSKEQIEKYRTALKNHNQKNIAGEFATKQEFKDSAKNVKELLKPKNEGVLKKIFLTPFRLFGKFVSARLEYFKTYNKPGQSVVAKFFRELPGKTLNGAAGIGRCIAIMASMGIVGYPVYKLLDFIGLKMPEEKAEPKAKTAIDQQSIAFSGRQEEKEDLTQAKSVVPMQGTKKKHSKNKKAQKNTKQQPLANNSLSGTKEYIPSPYRSKEQLAVDKQRETQVKNFQKKVNRIVEDFEV